MIDADIIAMSLDQSPCCTGWAIGKPCEVKPKSGVFEMEPWRDDEDVRLCDFYDWLKAKIKEHGVTHLFFESAVDMKFKSFAVTSKQLWQIGAVLMVARRCNIPIEQVTPNSWRLRFLGITKPVGITGDKVRPELKRMAVKACAIRNWYVQSDDEAEALGILDFGLSTLSQRHASSRDVLFGRASWARDVARFRGEA